MLSPNTGKVLTLLHSHETISGEDLAATLGISRAAVWKHIGVLRGLGYDITSMAGVGYALRGGPDLPLKEEVHKYLTTEVLGRQLIYLDQCVSSNTELKALADAGAVEGTVIVIDYQSGGRGRRGRTWLAEPGSALLFSLLLRPPLPPRELFGLTLMAGMAIASVLRDLGLNCGLKWPNDILVDGRKICGILAEVSGEMDHTNHVILGAGLNLRGKPCLEGYQTASLDEYLRVPTRAEVLAQILIRMEVYYNRFCSGNLCAILSEWKSLSTTLGQKVVAHLPQSTIEGLAIDLSPSGGLIIQLESGERQEITFGEVSLRSPGKVE